MKFGRIRQLMSWNQSGGSGDKDPWGRKNEPGPPDLDEIFLNLKKKLTGGGSGGTGRGGPPPALLGIVPIALLLIWLAYGIFEINEGETGIVLRFGEHVRSAGPGLHWRAPYIERLEVVNVGKIRTVEVGYRTGGRAQGNSTIPQESLMLTKDENIIDIKFAVQYRIKNATDYLFNLRNQVTTLHKVTESAIREVVGNAPMEYILTRGRFEVTQRVSNLVQETLDSYQAGILLTRVNMQDAQPPEQVQAAFSDAVKAREDEQRQINEAEAYRNDILPKASGRAARLVADADAYAAEIVERATGDAGRFEKILKEYKTAPDITRERLYLETMEEVYANSRKVIIDSTNNNNLLYLPIDKLMDLREPVNFSSGNRSSTKTPDTEGIYSRERDRGREVRP